MEIRGIRPGIGHLCLTTAGSPASPAARVRLVEGLRKPGRPDAIRKMLVIDDETSILNATKRVFSVDFKMLEVAIFNPTGLTQEQAAQKIAKQLTDGDIDLIVMDGLMPEILGKDLIAGIRTGGYTGYIAGNSSLPDIQDQLIEAGADFLMPEKTPVSWLSLLIKT